MRDYDEVTQTVLRRRDEQLARDRRKAMILRRSAAAALSVCAAAVIGISVFGHSAKDIGFNGDDTGVSETTSVAVTGYVITDTEPENQETVVTNTTVSAVQTTGISETQAPAITTGASLRTAGTAIHTTQVTKRPTAAGGVTTLVQTQAPPAVVTTTTVYDTERSVSMRKLMPFAAAITMLANAGAISASAAISEVPRTRLMYDELNLFAAMDDGEIDIDINNDGVFDIKDVYDFTGYILHFDYDEEFAERVESIGDYVNDGVVDYQDCEKLTRYYIVNNQPSKVYLTPEFYEPWEKIKIMTGDPIYELPWDTFDWSTFDKGAYEPEEVEALFEMLDTPVIVGYEQYEEKLSVEFAQIMKWRTRDLDAQYPLFKELADIGELDLDINSDGTVTFDDINIFYYYYGDLKSRKADIERNHVWIESLLPIDLDPDGLMEFWMPDIDISITDEQWAKCEQLEEDYYEIYGLQDLEQYSIWYLLERDGRPADMYFDKEYYESVLPGSGKMEFNGMVTSYYDELYPVSESMKLDYAELDRYINTYCDNVAAGNIVPPDANGDGVLNLRDVIISDMYLRDCKNSVSREASIIPESVWDFFGTQLDLNDNGIFGDICDVNIYQTSIYAYCGSIEGAEQIPEYDHEGYACFFNEYSEELVAAKLNSVQAAPAALEGNLRELRTNPNIRRSGDSNCDGTVDLADAIFIMQSMANPDKYQLSELGKFNADVYETGGGITSGDALAIQEGLLNGEY